MSAYARLAIVISLTAIFSTGIYWGVEAGWGRLEPIELVLADESDQSWLFKRLEKSLGQELKSYQGRWLWQVSLREILKEIEGDRRVRSAHVTRVFPNRLRITIEPHRPILAWVDSVGKFHPVASDASLLPSLPAREASDVPLLRGANFGKDDDLREKAILLLSQIPAEGVFSRQRIAEVAYENKNGFVLTLTEGGIVVRMGEDEFAQKAKRVERVLNYLHDQQLNGRVIDARFTKKVVVRLRNAP